MLAGEESPNSIGQCAGSHPGGATRRKVAQKIYRPERGAAGRKAGRSESKGKGEMVG